MKLKLMKNFSLVLWVIISICLIILSGNISMSYKFSLIVGEIAVFLGIANVFKSFRAWFLIDVGIGFLIYPVAKIIGVEHFANRYIKEVVLFLGGIIAMQLFFDDSLRNKNVRKRCTTPYQAKCISFEQTENSTYVPVYKYSVDGKVAMFQGNGRANVNPKLGDVITIFVNNKNEKEVYCPTSKAILMIRYLVGTMVLAFSTGTLIIL